MVGLKESIESKHWSGGAERTGFDPRDRLDKGTLSKSFDAFLCFTIGLYVSFGKNYTGAGRTGSRQFDNMREAEKE